MEYEELHKKIRKPQTEEEEKLLKRVYQEGLKNNWANGKYELADGNPIVEEDRLNKDSISFIDTLKDLKDFFKMGNWCLGQGIIYKHLFFLQQIDGGDEWATFYINDEEIKQFESVSFELIIKRREWTKDINALLKVKDKITRRRYFNN